MIFVQEELDWETYQLYGLLDEDLTYAGLGPRSGLDLGERAFEIALARAGRRPARRNRPGSRGTARRRSPTSRQRGRTTTGSWSSGGWTRSSPTRAIRLLEKPEFKRRWAVEPWEDASQERASGRRFSTGLRRRSSGATGRGRLLDPSAELADAPEAATQSCVELVSVLTGDTEADLVKVLASLVTAEAVPYLAAHRLQACGSGEVPHVAAGLGSAAT